MNYLRQFQFNEEVTGLYIDALSALKNPPDRAVKWMSHYLSAQQFWISNLHGENPSNEVWQIHDLKDMHELNKNVHQAVFELLEKGNLHHSYSYKNSRDEFFSNTLDEILTHLIIHAAHHRAQISLALRAEGIEPPMADFIEWARTR